jgi:hypothetical protein
MKYWYLFFAALAVLICIVVAVVKFAGLPSRKQIAKIREWLLFAATEAEANLGSGTGQLKLRMVYDMFVQRFPWLARLISFEKFSALVDEALVEMRKMLAKNEAVRNALGVWEE